MAPSARLRLVSLEDRATPSAYGQLPLAFEANQGQAVAPAEFVARGDGYALALGPTGATLGLRGPAGDAAVRLTLVGADPVATAVAADELVTKTNYFLGSDASQWRTNVPNYGKVTYDDVYPGIDLVYYGNQRQLEYDFVVAPGADPRAIRVSVEGAVGVRLNRQGDLVVRTAGGDVVQHAPVIYQEVDGVRRPVAGRFALHGTEVGFSLGRYDHARPLVIDPILSYSTYLGGSSSDEARAVAVDAGGNAYVTGYTYSANFPTTAGAPQSGLGGDYDVFVAKLNATGTELLYSTYLGGSSGEYGYAIAVDAAGSAYVTGVTSSANFPVTANALQTSNSNTITAFVTKLSATGSALLYSTFLGGSSGGFDSGKAIAVDGDGDAYVTGVTTSSDFPTHNPLQASHADDFEGNTSGYGDAFVTKLNASGSALIYSTFLGGSGDDGGEGIAVDAAGNVYIAGAATTTHPTDPSWGLITFPTTPGAFQTANASSSGVPFVTKLDASGSTLVYSTFLGGTTPDFNTWAEGIAVDAAGSAYVTGSTQAADFPTTHGAVQPIRGGLTDAFVTKLNPNGTGLVYSTYLGGSNTDQPLDIAVDAAGNAHVAGITSSVNFPTTANALQPAPGGNNDAFVAKLNGTGTALTFSTYFGGSGSDFGTGMAVDTAGNAYLVGGTTSANLPTTADAAQPTNRGYYDAFVAKLDLTVPPPSPTTLAIGDVTVAEGNAGTRTATFTVTRSGDTTLGATVDYATANGTAAAGSDYQAVSGTLTIPAGETSRTVTVLVNGDRLAEPNETVFVNLSSPTNATIADGQGVATILDDEPRISISDVSKSEGKKNQTTLFTFTIMLSAAYDQPVTMSFGTANGTATTSDSDYVSRTGTLTFAPGETTKTITVEVKGDSKREADETFYVDLSGLSASAAFTKSRGVGTILNDD